MSGRMYSILSPRCLCATIVLCGAMAATAQAQTDTMVITPSNGSNNFLYNNSPASNFSGSQLYYYDQRGSTNDSARPLLQFQLDSNVPVGATITNVQLQLKVETYTFINVNAGNATVPWPFSVYQMTTPWSATASNWTAATATTNWASPGLLAGSDFNATPLDTQTISSANVGSYVSWNITSAYLAWLANPTSNYGVTILGPAGVANYTAAQGDTTDGVFTAYSTNYANTSFQPHLVVTYTVPGPGSLAGLCAAGMVFAGRRRNR